MKRYGLTHTRTLVEVAASSDLRQVAEVKKDLGPEFSIITWVGFSGLPAAACVMRDDGQLETMCLYREEAERICTFKNEHSTDGHTYSVTTVLFNTAYPHAHGEYSV